MKVKTGEEGLEDLKRTIAAFKNGSAIIFIDGSRIGIPINSGFFIDTDTTGKDRLVYIKSEMVSDPKTGEEMFVPTQEHCSLGRIDRIKPF